MATDLRILLRDARDLAHDLGLGEHGFVDPRAAAMGRRLDQALADLSGDRGLLMDALLGTRKIEEVRAEIDPAVLDEMGF